MLEYYIVQFWQMTTTHSFEIFCEMNVQIVYKTWLVSFMSASWTLHTWAPHEKVGTNGGELFPH